MAKRFIDTGIFDEESFMDLSKDGKLFWLYYQTKCDHAGILKLNQKLCKVQTGIIDIQSVIKEFGNRLVTLSERLYFMPEYLDTQYPSFPNSNVKQQISAIEILSKYNLFNKSTLTLNEGLINLYDNDNDNVNDSVNEKKGGVGEKNKISINVSFEEFWGLYDKKVGDRSKLQKKWNELSDADRAEIMEYIPKYISSQPDKKFRKDPQTFLNNRSWNDELIVSKTEGNSGKLNGSRSIKRVNDLWKEEDRYINPKSSHLRVPGDSSY